MRLIESMVRANAEVSVLGVVIPVHNAAEFIQPNLKALHSCILVEYELVIIIDSCKDESKQKVLEQLKEIFLTNTQLRAYHVFESKWSMFETKADNFGFRFFNMKEFILELQADIQLDDKKFVANAMTALKNHFDLFMISGRGTHSWEFPYKPSSIREILKNRFREFFLGSSGRKVNSIKAQEDAADTYQIDRNSFTQGSYFGAIGVIVESQLIWKNEDDSLLYLGETVMRGPIMFKNSSLKKLGYLNQVAHRLGNDDHELSFRAWKKFNWRCAYLPCNFYSPLKWGATRKEKKFLEFMSYLKIRIIENFNFHHSSLSDYDSIITKRPVYEIRTIL